MCPPDPDAGTRRRCVTTPASFRSTGSRWLRVSLALLLAMLASAFSVDLITKALRAWGDAKQSRAQHLPHVKNLTAGRTAVPRVAPLAYSSFFTLLACTRERV
ncbi:unnamed protein product [Amoebophrya sp. A25]|nr:unnamed protein product [Amoebophrya sp. A25]|eukprot:GSA25T00027846001.1